MALACAGPPTLLRHGYAINFLDRGGRLRRPSRSAIAIGASIPLVSTCGSPVGTPFAKQRVFNSELSAGRRGASDALRAKVRYRLNGQSA